MFGLEYVIVFGPEFVKHYAFFFYWIGTGVVSFILIWKPKTTFPKGFSRGVLFFLLVNVVPAAYPVYTYFQYKTLCETEGYHRIYRTVELQSEHWDEKGRPKFFAPPSYKFSTIVTEDNMYYSANDSVDVNNVVRLYKEKIISNEDKEVLAEYSNVMWRPAGFPGVSHVYKNIEALSCGRQLEGKKWPSFVSVALNVFKKELR